MRDKARWKLAHLLNRYDWCWADLVTWAMRWHPFRGEVRKASGCPVGPDGGCYCGKNQL